MVNNLIHCSVIRFERQEWGWSQWHQAAEQVLAATAWGLVAAWACKAIAKGTTACQATAYRAVACLAAEELARKDWATAGCRRLSAC